MQVHQTFDVLHVCWLWIERQAINRRLKIKMNRTVGAYRVDFRERHCKNLQGILHMTVLTLYVSQLTSRDSRQKDIIMGFKLYA